MENNVAFDTVVDFCIECNVFSPEEFYFYLSEFCSFLVGNDSLGSYTGAIVQVLAKKSKFTKIFTQLMQYIIHQFYRAKNRG